MKPIRVVLADPHRLMRVALRDLITQEEEVEIVGEASNGKQVLRLTKQLAPDVVLLEPLISNPTGVEVTKRIESAEVPARVLALSRCKHRWIARRMLAVGAYGYFSKRGDAGALLDALRRVAAGKDGAFSTDIAQKLLSHRRADVERAHRLLTEREWEIMRFVAQGLSNCEIAERIYLSPGTVRNHVSHVLQKLDMSSRVKLAVWAHRHDLLCLPPTICLPPTKGNGEPTTPSFES